jgi:trk system potassium uptake protein TrkH
VGLVLLVPAGLALTGLGVALGAGEPAAALGFGATAVGGGGIGGALVYGLRAKRGQSALLARRAHAPSVMALAWLAAALLAAIPFAVVGLAGDGAATRVFADPDNALFESMSGLTSTGLTVSSDPSALPHALQWWRSILQWVGGIGILYFALALVPTEHDGTHRPELGEEMSTRGKGARLLAIWGIYVGYTALAILAFWAAGMPLWEAVNHGLTGIATGGFTVTADSFASYGRTIHLVGGVVIVLGAVSFGVHYAVLLRGQYGRIFRDEQNRLMALLLVAGGGGLALAVGAAGGEVPFADIAFQWASALLTAGFSTDDVARWGSWPLLLLILGMFVGGASGSTAGGLKQRRAVHLVRGLLGAERASRLAPALYQLFRLALTLAVGTALLVLLGGVGWYDALFEATSALGTVGLSVGVTGADLPVGGRLVLIGLMWAGRLEVAAVLALLARPDRAAISKA